MTKTGQIVISKKSTQKSRSKKILNEAGYDELPLKALIPDLGADPIILVNESGDIIYANKAAYKSHGYTREEFLHINILQIVSDLSRDVVERFYMKIDDIPQAEPLTFESIHIRKDGTYLPMEVHSRVIEYNGNKYYLNISRDITERNKMLKALEESEKDFRMLAENSKDMIIHLQLSPAFKLEYISPSATKITGYTPEELYADPTLAWRCIYPEDLELFRKYYELKQFDDKPLILRWITKDGSIKWCEHLNSAISDSNGNITGVQVMIRDITEQQKTLQALEESEKKYRMLAENAKDMILRISILPEFKFEYVSPSSIDMIGYTPEELYADPFIMLNSIYPSDMDLFHKYYSEHDYSEEHAIMPLIHKSGEVKWSDQLRTPTYNEDGTLSSVLIVVRDITERKKTEDKLAQEMIRRRILFEQSRDGIIILDRNGKIFEANRQFAEMLGYSLEEAQQLYVWEWDVNHTKKQHLEILRNDDITEQYVETTHRRKDGTEYFAEVNSYKAEFSGQQMVFSMCRDITERKQAEQVLEDEATRRRVLIDRSRDGIVVLDRNGKVFEANQRYTEMLGYSPEEIRQLHVWDWDVVLSKEQIVELLNRDEIADDHFETRQRRKDGTVFDVEMSSSSATIAGQKLIFCVCRDITDRKQAEAEQQTLLEKLQNVNARLEQSNRELQDFAYIASHDLREPLRKVSSFGLLLNESLAKKMNNDEKENLEFMIDGAQRMQTMIDDLLTYSRVTTKAKPPEPVDLNTIVHDLEKFELAALLEETGGNIVIPEPLPVIQGEESQMRQLFQNLIGNGLKFHKRNKPPKITVRSTVTDSQMAYIEIQDNGIGIAEEYHEHIFTMFKRLNSRDTYKGNGIGLAVCRKIVRRHGGEIGVTSKPGEGSTFHFTLPLAK